MINNSKKKVWYIVSNIDKSFAFEWISIYLNKEFYELHFILLNSSSSSLEKFLLHHGISVERLTFKSKTKYLILLWKLYIRFIKSKPDIIHTHLPDASSLGLLAGWIAQIRKRVYTRHHSTFHHRYKKKGVIKDRLLNFLATDIVAISPNVADILVNKEHVSSHKIHLIPHGFDLEKFAVKDLAQIELLRKKYHPANGHPVIGVIGRWIEWKGIQYVIEAFKQLLKEYPQAHLILANCGGSYQKKIEALLEDLPQTSYYTIKFEEDIFSLYHIFDVYVHTPVDPQIEAFGQTYVESLAAGVPSVFTLSGIAHEFIQHKRNALVVPYRDSNAIYHSIKLLTQNGFRKILVENGKNDVRQFAIANMIDRLEDLYSR